MLKALRLIVPFPLQRQGTKLHLLDAALFRRLGENRLLQLGHTECKLLCDYRHLSHRKDV